MSNERKLDDSDLARMRRNAENGNPGPDPWKVIALLDENARLRIAVDAIVDSATTSRALILDFAPMAERMLQESGAWEDCPFCDSAKPRGDKPYDWHAASCILHRFRAFGTRAQGAP